MMSSPNFAPRCDNALAALVEADKAAHLATAAFKDHNEREPHTADDAYLAKALAASRLVKARSAAIDALAEALVKIADCGGAEGSRDGCVSGPWGKRIADASKEVERAAMLIAFAARNP